jgi:hypothetical protein
VARALNLQHLAPITSEIHFHPIRNVAGGAMGYQILVCAVMALFIGTLIDVYTAAKDANPLRLDEHGAATAAEMR